MERSDAVRGTIGTLLTRVVVPLWVLTGAVFKLMEHTPKLLPANIRYVGMEVLQVPPYLLLAVLIALELLAVAVMVCLGRWARAMAIFMLGCFCLILIGEIVAGNTDCGCLGSHSPSIWLMLTIDAILLLGVLLFKPGSRSPEKERTAVRSSLATAALALAGSATAFGVIMPAGRPTVMTGTNGSPGLPDNGPTIPGVWFTKDVEGWVGMSWKDVELLSYLPQPPAGMGSEKHHVVFYGRTCDHCEEMFYFDLIDDPVLQAQITAVEVPYSKEELRGPGAWDLPETECEHMALPVGCDWILTTPLIITVEDGVVTCAEEGDHANCMGLGE